MSKFTHQFAMLKLVRHYARYILSNLAAVGFGIRLN
jgi:hypothetical protein